jgi:uncharacterized membrane protein
MTRIERSVLINAPVETVFDYAATVATLPEWWTSMTNVRNYGAGRAAKGLTYEWTYKMIGVHFDGKTEVTDVAENRRIVTRSAGGISSTIEQDFSDAGGGSTRFALKIEYTVPGSILGKIADKLFVERMNEREADHVVSNLKMLCEARAASAAAAKKEAAEAKP